MIGGRGTLRCAAATFAAIALVALTGCGSSKPSYCSDRSKLESSIEGLSTSRISGLPSQAATIGSDATALVNSAKGDFPNETSAIKTSVSALETAVKALPSNPSATQIAALAPSAAAVVSAVNNFVSTTKSKCS
jgi:hypothetical protein